MVPLFSAANVREDDVGDLNGGRYYSNILVKIITMLLVFH
jgi:hypothetical protein